MIFYFSGTGNSKWIANQLSKEQKEDLVFIPDTLRNGTSEFCLREDEKVGFVFPIYSWAPPAIVLGSVVILGGLTFATSPLCIHLSLIHI